MKRNSEQPRHLKETYYVLVKRELTRKSNALSLNTVIDCKHLIINFNSLLYTVT